jgi:transposase
LKNLTEAVERALQSRYTALSSAAEVIRQAQVSSSDAVIEAGPTTMLSSRGEETIAQNRERKIARYRAVMRLSEQGVSVLGIAQTLKMSRMTVYRYLNSEGFPERACGKKRGSALESFVPYIHERDAAGCHNATQIWCEIVKRGYKGKEAMVRRYVRKLRRRLREMPDTEKAKHRRLKTSFATPSAKRAAHLLLQEEAELKEEEKSFIGELMRSNPEVKQVCEMGKRFQEMVKERDGGPFEDWLKEALGCGIKEIAGFADGLRKDLAAVTEALRSEWSNGQTEGQVNRLKLIKRQMYGRAKFDLLKARVLYAA